MRRVLLILTITLGFTLLGCEPNENEFEFVKDSKIKEYSNEVIATEVPDEFKSFIENYFIDDFVVTDEYYFLSYVEIDENNQTVRRIAAFDSNFQLKWDNVYESDYYLRISYWNSEGIIVSINDDHNMLYEYIMISNKGDTIDSISSSAKIVLHNQQPYFVRYEETTNDYYLSVLEEMKVMDLHEVVGFGSKIHYCDDAIIIVQPGEGKDIILDIIDYNGELFHRRTYNNGEDIYTLNNGYLVDDEINQKIEIRNSKGNLVWEVEDLKSTIDGLLIKDGNLSLREGEKNLTISQSGKILSRKKISNNNSLFDSTSPTKHYYQAYLLRGTYTINESTTLHQVIVGEYGQSIGLKRVYFVKDDTDMLSLGGISSEVSVEYIDENYVYLYEKPQLLDYIPNISKLYLVNYTGEIEFTYNVISNSYDLDNEEYYYYFEANTIMKVYLPFYLRD